MAERRQGDPAEPLDEIGQQIATGELLVRVKSRENAKTPFCAGLVYDTKSDKVTRCAPILKYTRGLSAADLREVGRANGWTMTIVKIGE